MPQKVLIIGASSGMGAALAKLYARRGDTVAMVARRQDELDKLARRVNEKRPGSALTFAHDVTNFSEIPGLFQQIVRDLGGLDTIIYCAGAMPKVAANEYAFEKDKLVFDTNVLGAMAWLNEAAMRFDRQGTGNLVALGSVAGDRGRKGQPVYCASKAALETYMEGVRNRLPRSVNVVTIKPGPVKTPMTEGLKMPFMIEADVAARQIASAIAAGRNTAYVPKIWWPIMFIIRRIPSFLFRGKDI